jgi:hypothetical protein
MVFSLCGVRCGHGRHRPVRCPGRRQRCGAAVAAEAITPAASTAVGEVYQRTTSPGGAVRSRAEILWFFAGFDLVEPGLVWVTQWDADGSRDAGEHPEQSTLLAGVARKPTQHS